MPNNQQKEEWCGWCIRHPSAIANSGYEQQNTSGEWKGLCKRCASRRLNNPYNALLNIRKSLMPNNEQKEEVKCGRCRDTKKDSCGFLCWDCSKPESMVTGLEEDRKLQNQLVKFYWVQCQVDGKINWDLVDDTEDFSIIPTNSKGKIQLEVGELRDIIAEASKVFRANEARVVRAECAEVVRAEILKYNIEGRYYVIEQIDKILNNPTPLSD